MPKEHLNSSKLLSDALDVIETRARIDGQLRSLAKEIKEIREIRANATWEPNQSCLAGRVNASTNARMAAMRRKRTNELLVEIAIALGCFMLILGVIIMWLNDG